MNSVLYRLRLRDGTWVSPKTEYRKYGKVWQGSGAKRQHFRLNIDKLKEYGEYRGAKVYCYELDENADFVAKCTKLEVLDFFAVENFLKAKNET